MSVTMDDRTGFGIGLGYMLGQLKFNTYLSKDSQVKSGFRLRRSVTWRTPPPLHVIPYVQQVLDIGDFLAHDFDKEGFLAIITQKRLRLLLHRLDKEYSIINAFADGAGFHMWNWVFDNPVPSSYGKELVDWVKSYDLEYESVLIEKS